MVHYEPVKVMIKIPGLVEVIIDVVMCHHGIPELFVMDWDLLFTSKFLFSLYYFSKIKRKLSTAFQPQINGQTNRQNSTIKAYLRAFVKSFIHSLVNKTLSEPEKVLEFEPESNKVYEIEAIIDGAIYTQ